MSEKCKYLLPCGWCDKKDKPCTLPQEKSSTDHSDLAYSNKACIPYTHQWECTGVSTAGSSYSCKVCGTTKFEPHNPHITTPLVNYCGETEGAFSSSPCDTCSTNPKNGGSGNCNCTLGIPKVTCQVDNVTASASSDSMHADNQTSAEVLSTFTESRWSRYANHNQEKKHEE